MLTGQELGRAIAVAIALKGVSKKDLADHFGVKPPSVQDWLKRGVISKDKLPGLWSFFSDVVGPEHWGLDGAAAERASAPVTSRTSSTRDGWPFKKVSAHRIHALTSNERLELEEILDFHLKHIEQKKAGSRKKIAA